MKRIQGSKAPVVLSAAQLVDVRGGDGEGDKKPFQVEVKWQPTTVHHSR